GEVFQYSNLMAAAAGFIGGSKAVPGKEWGAAYDEAMQTKVFDPLGMKTTTFDFAKALKGNVAMPHGEDVDGQPMRAPIGLNTSIVPVRPAGGVWTSSRAASGSSRRPTCWRATSPTWSSAPTPRTAWR